VRAADSPRSDSVRATVMLVLTTFVWGLSFPLMKRWLDASQDCPGGSLLAAVTLILVRMTLGLVILALFRLSLFTRPSWQAHLRGGGIGVVFFVGFALQVLGLAQTTPALSGFITSLGSAWVPLLVFLWWRTKVPPLALTGIGYGVLGTAILAKIDSGAEWTLGMGDLLTLFASMVFAVEILLLDRLGQDVPSGDLTVSFFGMTALLSLLTAVACAATTSGIAEWIRWTANNLRSPGVALDLFLLTVFCTVLAFHWMTVYQPQVSASRAALIYLLEPLFSAVFSIAWGYDEVTPRLLLGGGIILGGNLLVDAPRLVQDWRKRTA